MIIKHKNQTTPERSSSEIEMLRKSLEEEKAEIVFFWKSFLVTGAAIFAGIIVMVLAGIAWFVSNNETQAQTSALSANGGRPFSLATLATDKQGIYDGNPPDSETLIMESLLAKALNRFWRVDRNGRDDEQGNHYTAFLDLPDLQKGGSIFTDDQSGNQYILGDSDGISLMVNGQSNVNNIEEYDNIGPGSRGRLTFYIIPHIDNLQQVMMTVSLKPFTLVREGEANEKKATGRAVAVSKNENTELLLNMISEHIMLFSGMEDGNYTNRISSTVGADGEISYTFTVGTGEENFWTKDRPKQITIYWIWPKRFENIKYCGQEDSVFKTECSSHQELLNWINTNRSTMVVAAQSEDITEYYDPTKDLSNRQLAQWGAGYNRGDQIIGDNIAFFQWIIEAE